MILKYFLRTLKNLHILCYYYFFSDKYYLVDAAYTHTKGFMAPFCHVCYWLNDFRSGGRARGREEIFNQFHSRTSNVIERAFGVLKARFLILKRMTPYSFGT